MSCLLYVNDEEAQRKIDIDGLYEKKTSKRFETIVYFQ